MSVSGLALRAQALPLTVPLSVAPLSGAAQLMVGAACAPRGMAPHSASAARAIGDLRNFMASPFFLEKERTGDFLPPAVVRPGTKARRVPAGEAALDQALISVLSLLALRFCGVTTTACRGNCSSHCFRAVLHVATERLVAAL